jgi:hypothetical protein
MSVKHRPPDFEVSLPAVHLSTPDLHELANRLGALGTLTITRGEFDYGSVEEWTSHTNEQSVADVTLAISTKDISWGAVRVSIQPKEVLVTAKPALREPTEGIVFFLQGKVKWYAWHPATPWWQYLVGMVTILAGVTIPLLVGSLLVLTGTNTNVATVLVMVLSIPMWFGVSRSPTLLGRSRIQLAPSSGAPSWWTRNGDAFVVNALIAVLAAFLTWLVSHGA